MIEQLTEPHSVALRDGREVIIRPLAEDDRAALVAFGRALPQDDLHAIADDLQNPEVIAWLVKMGAAVHWRQFVAAAGDAIVGYGAVRQLSGWSRDVSEIHLVVSVGWRRCGLGSALAAVILDAAYELVATELVVEMLEEQLGGRVIFERLGFSIEGVLEGQVCDRHGRSHDLLVMAYH